MLVRSGVSPEAVGAVESALGWDRSTTRSRAGVISPVSRSHGRVGRLHLFDWDTFFAAETAGLFSRDLAYANIVEMLNEVTPAVGFVPNYSGARVKSLDRSEPPVGSLVVLDTFRRFHERWLLDATFDRRCSP